jgi:hypothetical protein
MRFKSSSFKFYYFERKVEMKFWNRLKYFTLPLWENRIRDFISCGWLRRWFYKHPGHAETWGTETLSTFIHSRLAVWAEADDGIDDKFFCENPDLDDENLWIEWGKVKSHMVEAFRLLSSDLSLDEKDEKQEYIDDGLQLFARYYEGLWT